MAASFKTWRNSLARAQPDNSWSSALFKALQSGLVLAPLRAKKKIKDKASLTNLLSLFTYKKTLPERPPFTVRDAGEKFVYDVSLAASARD